MCLGSDKMRIHASGFGCTVEATSAKRDRKSNPTDSSRNAQ
jgi:hypothetical protein